MIIIIIIIKPTIDRNSYGFLFLLVLYTRNQCWWGDDIGNDVGGLKEENKIGTSSWCSTTTRFLIKVYLKKRRRISSLFWRIFPFSFSFLFVEKNKLLILSYLVFHHHLKSLKSSKKEFSSKKKSIEIQNFRSSWNIFVIFWNSFWKSKRTWLSIFFLHWHD